MKMIIALSLLSFNVFAQSLPSEEQIANLANKNKSIIEGREILAKEVNEVYKGTNASCSQYSVTSLEDVDSDMLDTEALAPYMTNEIVKIAILSSHCNVEKPTQDQYDWIDFIQVGVTKDGIVVFE